MIDTLDRVDHLIVRLERVFVAALLVIMGVVVFLDVMHRVSTRSDSWLSNPLVMAPVTAVVAVLAFRTRGADHALVKGLLAGLALVAAQFAFVRVLPNGLVWSQTLALALTLWLGTVGASLAAHEGRHLALDIGSKLWPPTLVHRIVAVGHVVTALFCVGLLYLALRSIFGYDLGGDHVAGHLDTWRESQGAAGTLSGTGIPKWVASASIPYGMAVLAFRFLLVAAKTWTGRIEVGGDDTLHQLGIEEEEAV